MSRQEREFLMSNSITLHLQSTPIGIGCRRLHTALIVPYLWGILRLPEAKGVTGLLSSTRITTPDEATSRNHIQGLTVGCPLSPLLYSKPMSGPHPTYFIPPNFDNPSDADGPIRLGQLISNPKDAATPIDRSAYLDPEANGLKVFRNSQNKFELQNKVGSHYEASLFAKALGHIGAKLGFKFNHEAYKSVLNVIDTLDVEFIQPSGGPDPYIMACMRRPGIERFVRHHLFRKRVFMVTGVKIARPGAATRIESQCDTQTGGSGEVSVAGGQVPAGSEAAVRVSSHEHHSLSFIPAQPFIYAYRLRECFYSGESKERTKGALYSLKGGSDPVVPIVDELLDEYVIDGVAEYDFCAEKEEAIALGWTPLGALDESDESTNCNFVFA